MKYRPFSDSQADRFLRFALDDEFARDREDLIDLLQQAKRANALAEAVERETSGWDEDNRVRRALAAYLVEEEE
jgi:hypothetical protein